MSQSQRDIMLSGGFYDPNDPALLAQAKKSRDLLATLAATPWDDTDTRTRLLATLLGSMSAGVWIETPFFCDYGNNIHMGENAYVNANGVFLDCAPITIGKNVLIGPAVQLYAVTHPTRAQDRAWPRSPGATHAPHKSTAKPITIHDDCWIGGGTIVLPGVTIGARTTIGAGSVVSRNIPAGVLAFGNPCRVVRTLE